MAKRKLNDDDDDDDDGEITNCLDKEDRRGRHLQKEGN